MSLLLKARRPCLSSLATPSLRRLHVYGEKNVTSDSSSFIHPTAIVHPDALIGQGVSIGPFCTIGSSSKLGDGCQLYPSSHIFGNTELGDQCILLTGAIVGDDLPGQTVIGRNNIIGHHAVVGVKCQDMKYKSGDECFLDVGNNNEFREHVSIHRSSKSSDRTVIGHNNLIMGSCHVAHDCKIGNYNIFANNTLLAGHVVVEDYTHTAGAIVVHQFCHVGSHSFIGGGSVQGTWHYRKIFMPVDAHGVGFEERLSEVEQDEELGHVPAVLSMLQSIRDSFVENRRGICRFRQWSAS